MARVHALNFVSTNFTVDKRGQKSVSKLKTVRIARRRRQNRLLISPGSSADVSTNFAVLLAFIANAFFVPLQLAFLGRGAPAAGWHAGLYTLYALVDAFFWLDIVKSFFTSVELGATKPPLLRPTKIARWYVLRWLALDVAAALSDRLGDELSPWRLLKRASCRASRAATRRSAARSTRPSTRSTTWRKAAEDALLARARCSPSRSSSSSTSADAARHAVGGGAVDAAGGRNRLSRALTPSLSCGPRRRAPHAPRGGDRRRGGVRVGHAVVARSRVGSELVAPRSRRRSTTSRPSEDAYRRHARSAVVRAAAAGSSNWSTSHRVNIAAHRRGAAAPTVAPPARRTSRCRPSAHVARCSGAPRR